MTEITKAVFTLRDFEVLSFAFQKHSDIKNPLNVNIQANGIFDPSTFEFILHLRFLANEILDDQNSLSPSPNITVHMACYFKFEDGMTLENIPSYFYKNSIAIVFPYLRAFVSNLTLQANTDILILPLYNVSALEKELRENTVLKS
jgi:preprotein translocase subunit SecB